LLLLSASVAFAAPAQLHLVSRGSLTVPAAGATAPGGLDTLVPGHAEVDLHAFLTGGPTAGHPLPTEVGNAPSAGISLLNPLFSGFDALDHADQRLAGTGVYTNTQFSLEPPDQGLCVGNGFVVETVNTAFAIYDRKGNTLAGPIPANQFFGVVPEIDRVTGVFGDFTITRVCYGSREGQKIDFVPLDNRLQLPASDFSYVLQDWDQALCVEEAFAQAASTVARMLGASSRTSLKVKARCHSDETSRSTSSRLKPSIVVLSASGKARSLMALSESASGKTHFRATLESRTYFIPDRGLQWT
jgi:hypothetical protein